MEWWGWQGGGDGFISLGSRALPLQTGRSNNLMVAGKRYPSSVPDHLGYLLSSAAREEPLDSDSAALSGGRAT